MSIDVTISEDMMRLRSEMNLQHKLDMERAMWLNEPPKYYPPHAKRYVKSTYREAIQWDGRNLMEVTRFCPLAHVHPITEALMIEDYVQKECPIGFFIMNDAEGFMVISPEEMSRYWKEYSDR